MSEVYRVATSWPPARTGEQLTGGSTLDWLERLGFVSRTEVRGAFALLPLGLRIRDKLARVAEEEFHGLGFSQVQFPSLQSREIWESSGRWAVYAAEGSLFTVRDGGEEVLALSPTSEEIAVATISRHLESYRDLPIRVSLSTTKFRNELSPRGGLMRGREFEMADAYTFDRSPASMAESYRLLQDACRSSLRRMGFPSVFEVAANGGAISSGPSVEFLVLSPAGQGELAACPSCGSRGDPGLIGPAGSKCPTCQGAVLGAVPVTELAHVFELGERYSRPMNLRFATSGDQPGVPLMACSGIGITRCVQALAETYKSKDGFRWPKSVAPMEVQLVAIRYDRPEIRARADTLSARISSAGLSVLVDDREVIASEKFRYSSAIGNPLEVILSPRSDMVEFRDRATERRVHLREHQVGAFLADWSSRAA